MELNEEYITSGSNQALLLAELWKNERLFLVAQSVPMKPEDFPMPSCALIYGIMLDYRRKYGKMPSMPALQDIVADTIRADGSYTESSIKEVCEVLSIMTEDTTMDFDYVNDRLVKFIRESRISEAIAKNPNDTERVAQAVKEVEKLSAAGFQETQISPFENFRALLPQTEDDLDVKIPTGIPFLDFVTNGGLNASLHEIGLGLAGTGVGKTNMMINFAISAAMAGYCTLFVTTELTQAQISRRLFAMAAHISMKEFKLPCSKWAKENLERLEYLSNSKLRDCIRIADRSKHACTVSDISGEVERWKRSIKELHGTDEKCKLVIIDWLDMLIPEPQMARTLQQPYQVLEQISKDLVHMVHNQDVALWCVSQTNRSGANAQKVQLNHASGAYAKNFFASIVLGLSKINEDDEDRSISQNMSEDDLKRLNIECNNDLHLSVIKNRDSVQRESDIYQGPTLRFWPSRSAWRTTEKILGSNDMKKIFGDGI